MAHSRPLSPQAVRLVVALANEAGAWRYGYDLSKATGLKSGTLYPLLMRLADRLLVEAEWRDPLHPGRPPRHVYRLTADGRALAQVLATEDLARAKFPRPARA